MVGDGITVRASKVKAARPKGAEAHSPGHTPWVKVSQITMRPAGAKALIINAFAPAMFKSRLSKQDSLICQKYFVQFLFFCGNICMIVYSSQASIAINSDYGIIDIFKIITFSVYMIFLYMITFAINYENFLSLRDPTHIFRILIMKTNNYLFVDLCIFIVAGIYIGLLFILKFSQVELYNEGINSFFIIHTDIWLGILLTLISLSTLLFYPLNIANFPNYKFASKKIGRASCRERV